MLMMFVFGVLVGGMIAMWKMPEYKRASERVAMATAVLWAGALIYYAVV